MTPADRSSIHFDPDAVHAKYKAERDKRMVKGRADIRDLTRDPVFAKYREDPFTPLVAREAIADDVEVVIVGAGMCGVVMGAKLREVGLKQIRLIDQAGGVGGTWYWNRYPGVMCDVESYSYMPMLEELNYIPKTRYAFGEEIRSHFEAIAQKYDLIDDALFHTGVQKSEWNESISRWVIHTDRGDEITTKYLIMAVGILNLMKLPVIAGMEDFQGKAFHSARWDYSYTGGAPDRTMDKLADKVVGVIGTGASAIQCIPPLAESAKHLYVFQRTPSAIGVRGNRPTDPEFAENLRPGWQRERVENFTANLLGLTNRDLIDDGWTHHWGKLSNPKLDPNLSPQEMMRSLEEFDFGVMEAHRSRIDEIVSDPVAAEILKPYYRYLCKRPCFHDEYLDTFNRSNVTLIDCPGGIDRVTEHGLVVNGTPIELDCIVYATGFEAEVTPFPRRAGHPIIGRDGITLAEKWKDGTVTLHGMFSHGFPNLFIMPAPGQQAVITVNITHLNVEAAEHIAKTIGLFEARGVKVFEVTEEAEEDWTAQIVAGFTDASAFMSACTPSRLNFEGDPSQANPRNGSYGGRMGNIFNYTALLKEWRECGEFPGLELKE